MDNIRTILTKMQKLLEELETVLAEEFNQLQRAQVNPISLQMLSDNKSRLLSAINFYDEQRKSAEKELNIAAPYTQHSVLKNLWNQITSITQATKKVNLSIFPLLELHMKKSTTLNSMVNKMGNGTSLYSQDGKSQGNMTGKVYNISI